MKNMLSKTNNKVLIACKVDNILIESFKANGYICIVNETLLGSEAINIVTDCIGIITSNKLVISKELIDAAPALKWVGRMGSGMEIIDVEYAKTKGIYCCNSPEGNCNAVGEHAIGMLLSLIRKIPFSRNEMINEIWQREQNRGTELEGKTIGIIGFGHTGSSFAKKLKGFDVNIIAYDKYHPENIPSAIEHCNDLERIYELSDIISFHVPIQTDTVNYFDNNFCNKMKKPFILINTARGQIVNTESLYNGLKNGKIIGACLDVFEQEPPSNDHKYFKKIISMQQVITTPHIAGYTHEALYKMSKVLCTKILNC